MGYQSYVCLARLTGAVHYFLWQTDPADDRPDRVLLADGAAGAAYEKLFFGNNLPAVTPAGASYTPLWDVAELARLSHTLRLGLTEFAARLSPGGCLTSQ